MSSSDKRTDALARVVKNPVLTGKRAATTPQMKYDRTALQRMRAERLHTEERALYLHDGKV